MTTISSERDKKNMKIKKSHYRKIVTEQRWFGWLKVIYLAFAATILLESGFFKGDIGFIIWLLIVLVFYYIAKEIVVYIFINTRSLKEMAGIEEKTKLEQGKSREEKVSFHVYIILIGIILLSLALFLYFYNTWRQ